MMKQFLSNLQHKHGVLTKTVLTIICILAIVWVIPDDVRFQYEFEKGKPWLHEDLYAPYDFAILKNESELKEEKSEIIKRAVPYYQVDSTAINAIYQNIELAIDVAFPHVTDSDRKKHEKTVHKLIDPVIQKGIVEQGIISDSIEQVNSIRLVTNHRVTDLGLDELYTLQQASDNILQRAVKLGYSDTLVEVSITIENLQPTVKYNKQLTDNFLDEKLTSIPVAFGKVKEAERIISKGEIVDDLSFRKLQSLKTEYEKQSLDNVASIWVNVGQIIITTMALLVLIGYLAIFRIEIYAETGKFALVLSIYTLTILMGSLSLYFEQIPIYLIPFPMLAILIRNFFDSRLAAFTMLLNMLVIGLLAPNGFEFVFIESITGLIAIFSMSNLIRRRQFIISTVIMFLAYSLVYSAFTLIKEGTPTEFETNNYILFAISSLLTLLTYPLVFLFEKAFGVISDITLLELSDTNNKLLRALANKAPGTFQHSIQVANLAEEAAVGIGAHALLVRTGALYHDIGKMENPTFFIENQTRGINPHEELTPEKSAKMIIGHVLKGIELARKGNLPDQIIDFIRTHHGTTKVRYFLHAAKQKDADVDESIFQYPGPIPFSKETALLMMADAVEASSRSLQEYTEESINNLVDKIIDLQLNEKQFNQSDITLAEITYVKRLFKKRLKSIYHVRVAYPEN